MLMMSLAMNPEVSSVRPAASAAIIASLSVTWILRAEARCDGTAQKR